MKKLLLLAVSGMFLVSCGGGGWSDEDKEMIMADCPFDSEERCECVLEATMDKWGSKSGLEKAQAEYKEMTREEKREFSKEMEKWEDELEKKCGRL